MRSALIVPLLFAATAVSSVRAQDHSFPYEAVVDADQVSVYSGPGQTIYYPTGKLSRGDRVIVHRHDLGGWYMIAPPPGSFSWIRADYVRTSPRTPLPQGEGSGVRVRGVLTANNVVVRVGSELGEQRDVEQIRLSTGAEVEILGETTFSTEHGPLRMYKIKPPPGEYRWIQGQFVVPVGDERNVVRIQRPVLRVEGPEPGSRSTIDHASRTENEASSLNASIPPNTSAAPGLTDQLGNNRAVLHDGPTAEELEPDRKRLEELDARFHDIVQRETAQWNFTQLERDYRTLQDEAAHPAVAGQIDLRLTALERYQTIKREYDEFVRLMEDTSRREAQLASLQQQQQSQPSRTTQPQPGRHGDWSAHSTTVIPQRGVAGPSVPSPRSGVSRGPFPNGQHLLVPQPTVPAFGPNRPASPWPRLRPGESAPQTSRAPNAGRNPLRYVFRMGPGQPGQPVPGTAPPQAATPQPRPMESQRPFDEVGIVQRAAVTIPGAPSYVLISANGRILAYLQPEPGHSLNPYVGRQMRVAGPRWHHRALKTDVIVVRTLTPVALNTP